MMHSLTVGDDVGVAQPTLNLSAGSVVNASAAITLKDNATVGFAIGGPTPADYARLTTAGIAVLDGDLAVQLVNDFLPNAGDMFSILMATSGISGTFDTTAEELPALDGGLQWQINYGENDVVLAIVAAVLRGDYNNDDTVNAADYTVWRNNLGAPAGTLPNDVDGGTIGIAQYATWKANYGLTAGSGALANAAVPEPDTMVLLVLAAMGWLFPARLWSSKRVRNEWHGRDRRVHKLSLG